MFSPSKRPFRYILFGIFSRVLKQISASGRSFTEPIFQQGADPGSFLEHLYGSSGSGPDVPLKGQCLGGKQ